jgi:hypothetical protein
LISSIDLPPAERTLYKGPDDISDRYMMSPSRGPLLSGEQMRQAAFSSPCAVREQPKCKGSGPFLFRHYYLKLYALAQTSQADFLFSRKNNSGQPVFVRLFVEISFPFA